MNNLVDLAEPSGLSVLVSYYEKLLYLQQMLIYEEGPGADVF